MSTVNGSKLSLTAKKKDSGEVTPQTPLIKMRVSTDCGSDFEAHNEWCSN